jgi:hypothetical protein
VYRESSGIKWGATKSINPLRKKKQATPFFPFNKLPNPKCKKLKLNFMNHDGTINITIHCKIFFREKNQSYTRMKFSQLGKFPQTILEKGFLYSLL